MNINHLSLPDALKEYADYRPDKICLKNSSENKKIILPIEKTVSIMIAVDIITYRFKEEDKITIDLIDNRNIAISSELNYIMQPLSDKDKEMLAILLESSKCTLTNKNGTATITIDYNQDIID